MLAFFNTYGVTTEVLVAFLCIVMLLIIAISKPVNTFRLKLVKAGFWVSIISILSHISMLTSTFNMSHGRADFKFRYIIFAISYITVLVLIYIYIDNLAYRKKRFRGITLVNNVISALLYGTIFFTPLIRGQLLEEVDGVYHLTKYFNSCAVCSLLTSIFMGLYFFINRKNLSKTILAGCCVFLPVALFGTIAQFFFVNTFFVCATYTMPFVLFFLLFHCFRYDEVIGCQNYDAESNMINNYINSNKQFIQIMVRFPKLENHDLDKIKDEVSYAANKVCRKAERMRPGVRIYKISTFCFSLLAPVKDEADYEDFKKNFFESLRNVEFRDGMVLNVHFKSIVSGKLEGVKDANEYLGIIRMVDKRFDTADTIEVLEVTPDDVKIWKKSDLIERELLNIASTGNLDDERVLLYIQPIYSIKKDCFKTGEALMRLKIDGLIYYPDSFIGVAENIGCIHTLTRIILNKAAKKTVELSKYPEFDAISVNVSTSEFSSPGAAEEFIDIIKNAGANPSNIRLEITESTTITDYDIIIDNMKKLDAEGISFYLDDFGTGFSNLDRVVGMPFKTIKFDKSLLYKALKDEKSENMFKLLHKFCKSNMLSTVIEGVEDNEQKEYVKELGFDYIQGYFYSKPVAEKECDSFYANMV